MMFEEVAPIGTVTPMHLHHDSDEVAYVLSGEITFKIGDTVTVGGPGTCAFMPRDVAHAWKSTGAEAGRVLFLYTPGGAGGPDEPREIRPGCTARLRRLSGRRRSEQAKPSHNECGPLWVKRADIDGGRRRQWRGPRPNPQPHSQRRYDDGY